MSKSAKVSGVAEDDLTAALESKTARIPSSAYLAAAVVSMGLAAGLKMAGKNQGALFVGQWAAPLLLMGVYNKMVKQHGSDLEGKRTKKNHGTFEQGELQSAAGA